MAFIGYYFKNYQITTMINPSTRKTKFFSSSKSILVFLTRNTHLADTDSLLRVSLVFWKEFNEFCKHFFFKNLFFCKSEHSGIPPVCCLNVTACFTISYFCPLVAKKSPLNGYLKRVFRQSTR